MKRVAIYARYSTDRQNERSARDQADLCRAWAQRQGDMLVVAEYRDEAISGASTVNRLELGRLMRDAREKAFDVVLCEALDRLSRDQADLATIRKQLQFLDIGISTVADGEVGAIHVGLKGLMGELFLADLAAKTHRGLRARVAAGGSGGGRSYGYVQIPNKPGELAIAEDEAAIVRRIFAEYVAGRTPLRIVGDLNREGVPGPSGRRWNQSTVNGNRERQNGILFNRLYIGERIWNRQRFVKDPATGKRVSRPNPESEWLRMPVPELAIVDPAVFAQAQAVKATKGARNAVFARRPPHLFSGLLKCACCGAGFTIVGRDRLRCAGVKERGDCANRTTIARREVEDRVLAALQHNLASPERIALFVREYQAEMRRLGAENRAQRAGKERRLAELTRSINRAVEAILEGSGAGKALAVKLESLEAEAEALKAELAQLDDGSQPVELHPAAARRYAAIVADLQAHLAGLKPGAPTDEALAKVRGMIERIEIGQRPDSKKPATIVVHGLIAELLWASGARETENAPMMGNVGCGSPRQTLPVIRLAA